MLQKVSHVSFSALSLNNVTTSVTSTERLHCEVMCHKASVHGQSTHTVITGRRQRFPTRNSLDGRTHIWQGFLIMAVANPYRTLNFEENAGARSHCCRLLRHNATAI